MNISVLLLAALLSVAEPEHDPSVDVVATTISMYGIDAETLPLDPMYVEHVCEVCRAYILDPAVLFGMMWQESRFQPQVVGDHGRAIGILQIQPRWHGERMQRLGVTDLADEWQAIYVACDYLAEIREKHPDIREMLTIYRYGDLNVVGEDYAGLVMQKADVFRQR